MAAEPIEVNEPALLQAHADDDKLALSNMYALLGKQSLALSDHDQAAFFYTQAYVFGLDCGAPHTASIREILVSLGSE